MARAALAAAAPAELEQRLHWTGAIAPTLTEGLKSQGKPPQGNRFLNAFLLREHLADVAGLDIRDDVLVKLMLLEYREPDRFEELYRWQVAAADGDGPPQLRLLEGIAASPAEVGMDATASARLAPAPELAAWQAPAVQDWLRLEPALADVDLRDYFWIARDQLGTTLSGLTLVPPVVRALLQGLITGNEGEREMTARESLSLAGEERAELLRLLGQQVRRRPEDPGGVAALVVLVNLGMPGALEALLAALGDIPTGQVAPNVAYELQTIATTRLESKVAVSALLGRWAQGQTRVSVSARDALDGLGGSSGER
jgi:hypothetical protein